MDSFWQIILENITKYQKWKLVDLQTLKGKVNLEPDMLAKRYLYMLMVLLYLLFIYLLKCSVDFIQKSRVDCRVDFIAFF